MTPSPTAIIAFVTVAELGYGARRCRAAHTGLVDVDAFIRDGYVVIRGAFDSGTAVACRAEIWAAMAGQEVREDDPATAIARSSGLSRPGRAG